MPMGGISLTCPTLISALLVKVLVIIIVDHDNGRYFTHLPNPDEESISALLVETSQREEDAGVHYFLKLRKSLS